MAKEPFAVTSGSKTMEKGGGSCVEILYISADAVETYYL